MIDKNQSLAIILIYKHFMSAHMIENDHGNEKVSQERKEK